jgi:hypothetical protein
VDTHLSKLRIARRVHVDCFARCSSPYRFLELGPQRHGFHFRFRRTPTRSGVTDELDCSGDARCFVSEHTPEVGGEGRRVDTHLSGGEWTHISLGGEGGHTSLRREGSEGSPASEDRASDRAALAAPTTAPNQGQIPIACLGPLARQSALLITCGVREWWNPSRGPRGPSAARPRIGSSRAGSTTCGVSPRAESPAGSGRPPQRQKVPILTFAGTAFLRV